jgi:hypothetical protein
MKPKRLAVSLFGCAVLAAVALLPRESIGQASEEAQIQQLMVDIIAQQAVMADNQNKIDEKVAAIAEEVRIARIYAARTGGKVK